MPRTRRTVLVVLCIALAVAVSSSAVAGGGSCYWHSKKDRALAKKTNSTRSHKGVRKMNLDPRLSYVAKRHTRAMVSKKTLYHSPSLGSLVTNWKILGENVGYASSVKKVHKAFMGSSGHKANILRSGYKNMGVGVVKKGGRTWATVVFQARKKPGTTLKMPPC